MKQGEWHWAGDGNTANGTTAQLPQEVYDFADAGRTGEIQADGVVYRVEELPANPKK